MLPLPGMQPTIRRGHSIYHRFFPGRTLLWRFVARWRERLHGRLLDIGGGSRPYGPLVAPGTRHITLETTPQQRPDVIGDALRLPFHDDAFEAILCTEVLEHIFEVSQALAEIRRVLRPGGSVIITTPFHWGLHYEPQDYFRFTPYALRHLLTDARLEVVEIERLGGLWMASYLRLTDVGHDLGARWLGRIGLTERWRERLFKALRAVPNLLALWCCPLLDRLHPADAMNYGCVAIRPARSCATPPDVRWPSSPAQGRGHLPGGPSP